MRSPDDLAPEVLQRVVAEALRYGRYPLPADALPAADVERAAEAGRLAVGPEGITVSDPASLHDRLVQEVATRAAAAWPDLDAAHEPLDRFARLLTLSNLPDSLWTRLARTTLAEQGLDLFDVLRAAAEAPRDDDRAHPAVWTLYPPLAEALPDLNPDPDRLARALGPVLEAVGGDVMNNLMHVAVERLAATSPVRARGLIAAFARRPERPSVQLVANALVGLGRREPDEAHRRALDLSRSDVPPLRHAGTSALGWLSYGPGDPHLVATLLRLDEIRSTPPDGSDLPVVAQALGALAGADPPDPPHLQARRTLVELAGDAGDRVGYVAAWIAARVSGDAPDAPWLRDLLAALAPTPAAHKGTLRWVDHALSNALQADPLWAVGYLRRVVESRPYAQEGDDDRIDDLIPMTVSSAVREHRHVLQAEVTRWLASGAPALQAAAGDLLAYGHIPDDGAAPFCLDAAALATLDDPARERALFALLGHLPDHRRLAPLLVSLVSGPWAAPRLQGLAASALADVALYDYPGSSERYLTRVAVREDTAPEAWPVVAQALTRSATYYAALQDRPNLKELHPPDHRIRRHLALQHDQTREIRKRAHQESDFLSLFTTIPLKVGRAWFSERDGQIEPPTPLGTTSHSMEVARSLNMDPLGFTMRRHEWRYRAALPDPAALDA